MTMSPRTVLFTPFLIHSYYKWKFVLDSKKEECPLRINDWPLLKGSAERCQMVMMW